jgi:elongator complex protein 4
VRCGAVTSNAFLIDKSNGIISRARNSAPQTSSMAFRKRNVALSRAPADGDAPNVPAALSKPVSIQPIPGVRPSPIDGRPTTSTGTPSLDSILAGHAGLPLGTSLVIEESGTTDYAGALLRFYAAEGVVQGHKVHVVGMGEVWGRELPGITEERGDSGRREGKERAEKMKIAWRYEGLGQFESSRGASCVATANIIAFFEGF